MKTIDRAEILRMADEADLWADQELQCIGEYHPDWHEVRDLRFAALIAAAERERIDALYALYEQACRQRDELMDQQRATVAAMRGKLQ